MQDAPGFGHFGCGTEVAGLSGLKKEGSFTALGGTVHEVAGDDYRASLFAKSAHQGVHKIEAFGVELSCPMPEALVSRRI